MRNDQAIQRSRPERTRIGREPHGASRFGISRPLIARCAGSVSVRSVQVNEVYLKFFTKNPPARSCFAVAGLPRGGLVEIEAIALVSGSKL